MLYPIELRVRKQPERNLAFCWRIELRVLIALKTILTK
jgi:hypothetical protein